MPRRSILPLLVAVLAIVAGLAAAPSASARIVIGQSIAGIKLGDTKQQVEQSVGPLSYSKTAGLFHPRREASLHVHFTSGKVDLVGLFAAYGQKTATGIEVGSTRGQFKRAYPQAHCIPDGRRETLYCYISAHFRGFKTYTEFRFGETGQLEEIGLAYTLGPGGPVRIATAPGVQVTGQFTNLTLCTPYTYKVSVVSSKPHREAVVALVAYGANNAKQRKTVNLVAGRKWTGTFTEYFSRPADMSKGLQVVVMVLPPHRGYTTLLRRTYAITPAPEQGEAPRSPGSCGPVPPYFGS